MSEKDETPTPAGHWRTNPQDGNTPGLQPARVQFVPEPRTTQQPMTPPPAKANALQNVLDWTLANADVPGEYGDAARYVFSLLQGQTPDVGKHGGVLSDDLSSTPEPDERRTEAARLATELDVCAWFQDGTNNGEKVELAHFTRDRSAKAMRDAAYELRVAYDIPDDLDRSWPTRTREQ
jgi:hypothetical protein